MSTEHENIDTIAAAVWKAVGAMLTMFLLVPILIILSPFMGMLFGAFAGWLMSWIAPVWIPTGLSLIFGKTITASDLVAFGAALGWLSGFLTRALSGTIGKSKEK